LPVDEFRIGELTWEEFDVGQQTAGSVRGNELCIGEVGWKVDV
jgi:hypothetical protein